MLYSIKTPLEISENHHSKQKPGEEEGEAEETEQADLLGCSQNSFSDHENTQAICFSQKGCMSSYSLFLPAVRGLCGLGAGCLHTREARGVSGP